jgi:hypothetical protein
MKIYKFKDVADGNFAFIMANSESDAILILERHTSIAFLLVGSKNPSDLNRPIILLNNILPF